jgi:hypothetical protein
MADRARGGLAAVLFALALIGGSAGTRAGGGEDDLVELQILNTGAQTLRCVTVLAHFVSLPAVEVDAGGAISVSFFRGTHDGTLYVLRDDGRRMMIENLLCGSTDDWDATRGEVPLLQVRSSSAERMAFSCHIATRLACAETA